VLPVPAVSWAPDQRALRYLDQRALPAREVVVDVSTIDELIDAIRMLAIRGAPAIGVGAALGLFAALQQASRGDGATVRALLPDYAQRLVAARPTAVNLAWAVGRMVMRAAQVPDDALLDALLDALRQEADDILREDIAMCAAIGAHGQGLIPDGARVLTHCNAGALATAGIGTALAPVYAAHADGRRVQVYADETRPLRQGARLTAWELQRAGIDVTVLPDGAAASLLRSGVIDLVIVGADRIAANGDVANKIGTYGVALAAHAHGIPFYVAAPWSTIDPATTDGASIVIEHRHAAELGELPPDVAVWNPAFDVTPHTLIRAYITDRGLVGAPFVADAALR
jgi:methylthioribose-1-phosphate isomerase